MRTLKHRFTHFMDWAKSVGLAAVSRFMGVSLKALIDIGWAIRTVWMNALRSYNDYQAAQYWCDIFNLLAITYERSIN